MKIRCSASIRPYCLYNTDKCCVVCTVKSKCIEENRKQRIKLIPCGDEHIESLRECGFCAIDKAGTENE